MNVESSIKSYFLHLSGAFVLWLRAVEERRCGRVVQESEIRKFNQNMQIQIGQRIQEIRLGKGLFGADVGAYLDISPNQVSRIETGKAKCSLEHIVILCQLLDCSADYLLLGEEKIQNFTQEQVACLNALINSFSEK
jgi:DNA-binding Xre family transcriptional regulator